MNPSGNRDNLQQKALRLLARRSFSRGELRDRLSDCAQEQDLDAVLDRLGELNLLNDLRYAYNFAAHRSQRGWGPVKIRAELARRQVPWELIHDAMSSVLSETDETLILARYLKRLLANQGTLADEKKVQRLLRHLQRRGFSKSTILGCLTSIVTSEVRSPVDKES